MTSPLIGVVGCGGAVGSAAVEVLLREGGMRLRGGHRRAAAGVAAGFERIAVDVEDPRALARFCDGCRVVLNCAGPSCVIGDRVARAAAAAGADYVDAFGSLTLERLLAEWGAASARTFIVAAGVFPGLSGILPRWLARQGFDRVERLRAFVGGREHCSPAGGADVLLSSLDGFGTAGAIWTDGRVQAAGAATLADVELPGFPGRVHAQPFLSREMEQTAMALGLARAEWFNVASSAAITEALARGCARLSAKGAADSAALAGAVAELVRTAELEMAGRTPFYVMSMELAGTFQGSGVCRRALLRGADSYRLSGMVAALSVRHLLEHRLASGVYRAAEVLDPAWVVSRLTSWEGGAELHLVEAPSAGNRDGETVEEGTI